MTRWGLITLSLLLAAGLGAVALARLLGRSDSPASVGVSIVAQWLGAYVLWNFAGGLALYYGVLVVYDGTLFTVLALGMGIWQYRTRRRAGREPALAIFVGGQLVWLAIVSLQNGLLKVS
jgi:hypothetical protein